MTCRLDAVDLTNREGTWGCMFHEMMINTCPNRIRARASPLGRSLSSRRFFEGLTWTSAPMQLGTTFHLYHRCQDYTGTCNRRRIFRDQDHVRFQPIDSQPDISGCVSLMNSKLYSNTWNGSGLQMDALGLRKIVRFAMICPIMHFVSLCRTVLHS